MQDPVPTHPEAVPGDPATVRWIVPGGLLGMVGPVGRCPEPLAALRAPTPFAEPEDSAAWGPAEGAESSGSAQGEAETSQGEAETSQAEPLIRAIVAEPAALRLTLAPGRTWRADGARVRTALVEALGQLRDGAASLAPEPVVLGMPGLSPRPGSAGPELHGTSTAPDTCAAHPTDPTPTQGEPTSQGERPSSGSLSGDSPDAILQAAVDEALAGPAGQYLRSHGGTVRVVSAEDGAVVLDLGGTCRSCPARGFTLQMRLEAEIRRLYPDLREVRTAG